MAESAVTSSVRRVLEDTAAIQSVIASHDGSWRGRLWSGIEEVGMNVAAAPESSGGAGLGLRESFDLLRVAGNLALEAPIADYAQPDCVVEDVLDDGVDARHTSIARCDDGASVKPCWRLVEEPDCKSVCNPITQQPQKLAVQILRDHNAENGTIARVSCATIAVAGVDTTSACAP